VSFPFTDKASFDFEKLDEVTRVANRMLDNVLDLTPWPLPQQESEAQSKRRIGIGFTGLADVLIMMGLKYSSQEGRNFAEKIMEHICYSAYSASVDLAKERGAFDLFDADGYLEEGTFASRLPADLKEAIRTHGIRNSHLLSLAPTGTGSLTIGNNCSGGCEPVFDFVQRRKVKQADGSEVIEEGLMDYAYLVYRQMGGDVENLPDYFESVATLNAQSHVEMLKVLAPLVDAAISKTVNVPADYSFDDFKNIYVDAWKGKLKGITTYRPNVEIGEVLMSSSSKEPEDLDTSDPDRRFKLDALPETVMSSMRWPSRPVFTDGNPAHTYMVEHPQGDFAVMIGHVENGHKHAFEVWTNGAECPRGLGAVAKTLSGSMRSFDTKWVATLLESLIKSGGDDGFALSMPPTGETLHVPSLVSGFARIVQYHLNKIGSLEIEGETPMMDAMIFRKEPKAGTNGTLSWTVDIKNPATGDDFVMFVKELEMPDGTRRPYSVWLAGDYPRTLDGLCKLLSFDMRIVDVSWIGMKLRKLLNYKEHGGDFLARVPGGDKQASYPSTVAYMASLLIHRYQMLGLLTGEGKAAQSMGLLKEAEAETVSTKYRPAMSGKKCEECGVNAVVKYNGCEKCSNCGAIGSCG
jgi:ribonucleoside-diphosphate reductase alpha chain